MKAAPKREHDKALEDRLRELRERHPPVSLPAPPEDAPRPPRHWADRDDEKQDAEA